MPTDPRIYPLLDVSRADLPDAGVVRDDEGRGGDADGVAAGAGHLDEDHAGFVRLTALAA